MKKLNKVREEMIENQQNLGWCKPIEFANGKVIIVRNEGEIISALINGEDISKITPEIIKKIAKTVNPDYESLKDDYRMTDDEIIADASCKELPCAKCPWFHVCEAMEGDE